MPETTVPRDSPGNRPNPKPAQWTQSRELRTFLGLFYELLEELASDCYFTEKYGDECSDSQPIYWSASKIQAAIAIHGLRLAWPLTPEDLNYLDQDITIRYLEFFYRAISKPVEGWHHPFCEGWHPTAYDQGKGRIEYENRVNVALVQSGLNLILINGKVQHLGNRVSLSRLADDVDYMGDEHMEKVIDSACEMFRSGDEQQQLAALTQMANVFERIKMRMGNGDKRSVVESINYRLQMDERLNPYLENLFRTTSDISNNAAIRHHEDDRIPIFGQTELIEFLFFHYYNMIRFCITVYSKQSRNSGSEDENRNSIVLMVTNFCIV